MPVSLRRAAEDPRLRVDVTARWPLRYAEGPDAALDRPGHVRAASAVLPFGKGLVVVQDDALFLGAIAPAPTGAPLARSTPLAAPDGVRLFDDLRGNKAAKADLEAACLWPVAGGPCLVAFGSGSTPRRERLLVQRPGAPPAFVPAPELYAALRDALPPGVELNVEGAFAVGGALRLLQRGNGAGGWSGALDVDAAWLDTRLGGGEARPRVRSVVRWDLGELGGVPLTFTDGAPGEGARWRFAAAAEDSPDAVADGPVTGSVVGWADDEGGAWAPVTEGGRVLACKLEGLTLVGGGEAWGVVDADDPEAPSELLRLRFEGPWP